MALPSRTADSAQWARCPSCEAFIYFKHLRRNLGVCPECNYHFRLRVRDRLDQLLDPDSF
jgi:acetyl-CoA carboxylase carboxyl transferase subunit beta